MHQPKSRRGQSTTAFEACLSVVVDGKLAGCCAERGPEEAVLRHSPDGFYRTINILCFGAQPKSRPQPHYTHSGGFEVILKSSR